MGQVTYPGCGLGVGSQELMSPCPQVTQGIFLKIIEEIDRVDNSNSGSNGCCLGETPGIGRTLHARRWLRGPGATWSCCCMGLLVCTGWGAHKWLGVGQGSHPSWGVSPARSCCPPTRTRTQWGRPGRREPGLNAGVVPVRGCGPAVPRWQPPLVGVRAAGLEQLNVVLAVNPLGAWAGGAAPAL